MLFKRSVHWAGLFLFLRDFIGENSCFSLSSSICVDFYGISPHFLNRAYCRGYF